MSQSRISYMHYTVVCIHQVKSLNQSCGRNEQTWYTDEYHYPHLSCLTIQMHNNVCWLCVRERARATTHIKLDGDTHIYSTDSTQSLRSSKIKSQIFLHIELPAKLLDYFLRSNKININQSGGHTHTHVV